VLANAGKMQLKLGNSRDSEAAARLQLSLSVLQILVRKFYFKSCTRFKISSKAAAVMQL
jgi:hypothetical protein